MRCGLPVRHAQQGDVAGPARAQRHGAVMRAQPGTAGQYDPFGIGRDAEVAQGVGCLLYTSDAADE